MKRAFHHGLCLRLTVVLMGRSSRADEFQPGVGPGRGAMRASPKACGMEGLGVHFRHCAWGDKRRFTCPSAWTLLNTVHSDGIPDADVSEETPQPQQNPGPPRRLRARRLVEISRPALRLFYARPASGGNLVSGHVDGLRHVGRHQPATGLLEAGAAMARIRPMAAYICDKASVVWPSMASALTGWLGIQRAGERFWIA